MLRYLIGNMALHCAVIAAPDAESGNSHVELILQHTSASLNAKNTAGQTPLQLAFSLRRIMAAKSLIKAGADPTSRDNTGRNLLHLILVRSIGGHITLTNLFKALCDILDPELIKELATQRSYTASKYEDWGLQTPLAIWLKFATRNQVDMLRAILGTTGGRELYVMDGKGNYPIHQVVMDREFELAQVMLEFDPTLAQIENATGVTPLELSQSKLLRSQLLQSCELSQKILYHNTFSDWSSQSRKYKSQLDNEDSEDKSADDRDPSPFSSLDTTERHLWELLRNSVSENPLKRKLVSLQDANQLVKRLASKRWRRAGQEWTRREEQERDESVEWVNQRGSDNSFEVDPFKEEAKRNRTA